MLRNVAEKVLKRQISRSEYLDHRHLHRFWLKWPNEDRFREGNENKLRHTNGNTIVLQKPSLLNGESQQNDQMQTSPDRKNSTIALNSEIGTGSPQLFRRNLNKPNGTTENEDGYSANKGTH